MIGGDGMGGGLSAGGGLDHGRRSGGESGCSDRSGGNTPRSRAGADGDGTTGATGTDGGFKAGDAGFDQRPGPAGTANGSRRSPWAGRFCDGRRTGAGGTTRAVAGCNTQHPFL